MKISYRNKDYMYSYEKITPPTLQMHMHNYYEFLYFLNGNASYIVENSLYKVSPGDLFITRPNELHTISFHSDDIYERHFIQISPDYLKDIDLNLLSMIDSRKTGTLNKINADVVKSYGLQEYFTMVEQYIVNRVPESDILIKTFVIQMLVKINSAMREYPQTSGESTISNTRIAGIKEYIDCHITEELSLDLLCKNFYISKYHLSRTFKNCTGLSLNEYINMRRITMAKQMIFEGYNITNVCFECGFKDYSTFYKAFKKLTNVSPRDFFKQHRAS